MDKESHAAEPAGKIIDLRFLGLAMMEFWERFAMSGVKSLLILVLVDHLLKGDIAGITGAIGFRRTMESIFGPLSVTAVASQIYGVANALIYLSIPLGGLLGDVLPRRTAAVYLGGTTMLAGLSLMASGPSFLLGLVPFAVGTGLLKGNLSAQVGLLFQDEARRQRGYSTYLAFLNAGVICGPLVCGALAAYVGWRYAMWGAAAALAIGLVCYSLASSGKPALAPGPTAPALEEYSSATTMKVTLLLIAALLAIDLCYSAYDQLSGIFLLWAQARIDLRVFGAQMQVPWFLSLDGLFTLLLIPVSQIILGALERRGLKVGVLYQILLGSFFCAAGYFVLAIGNATSGHAALPLPWALLYLVLIDSAIVLAWPAGLSLIASVAPRRRIGFWIGLFYLHGFAASLWVGISGTLYGRISTTGFWLLHAAVAATGIVLILAGALPLMRALQRRDQATMTSAWANARA